MIRRSQVSESVVCEAGCDACGTNHAMNRGDSPDEESDDARRSGRQPLTAAAWA